MRGAFFALTASSALSLARVARGQSDVCPAIQPGKLGGDSFLLQVGGRAERFMPLFSEEETEESVDCSVLENVKKSCSEDGCKVLTPGVTNRTCDQYCGGASLECLEAGETENGDCVAKSIVPCGESVLGTSDLLCHCGKAALSDGGDAGTPAIYADSIPCDNTTEEKADCSVLPDVEVVCSPDGCKVLADKMTGRTCKQYCEGAGLRCLGAWEEVEENCVVKASLRCEQTFPGTSDLICHCGTAKQEEELGGDQGSPVWADEFDDPQGTGRVDSTKWKFVTGGGGFGNRELQHYTSDPGNVRVTNGVLRITAKCQGNSWFTSAKLVTKGLSGWGPGHRVEVRAKLPRGRGTWPAIWLLPSFNTYGWWPKSGEIDLMEAVGCTRDKVYGTVHTESFNHMKRTEKFSTYALDYTQWHTYAIEWRGSKIDWFVDGIFFHSFRKSGGPNEWPFDKEFYLILNLAVGGSWGGFCLGGRKPSCRNPDEFGNDQIMEIDFARVFAI